MDPRLLPWALVLLGPALILALGRAPAPETPEKLCGRHFVRALVGVCGGPRWSPEPGRLEAGGNRELLQWLEGLHLHGLVANRDSMLLLNPQPQGSQHHRRRRHRRRRAATTNPAHHCCLSGCTWQDLLALCPH